MFRDKFFVVLEINFFSLFFVKFGRGYVFFIIVGFGWWEGRCWCWFKGRWVGGGNFFVWFEVKFIIEGLLLECGGDGLDLIVFLWSLVCIEGGSNIFIICMLYYRL